MLTTSVSNGAFNRPRTGDVTRPMRAFSPNQRCYSPHHQARRVVQRAAPPDASALRMQSLPQHRTSLSTAAERPSKLVPRDADEFVISVAKTPKMAWGLEAMSPDLAKNKVVVAAIKEDSVLGAWNKGHPDSRLSAYDLVVEINGKVGAQDMVQDCKTAQVLHMRVKRGGGKPFVPPGDVEPWLGVAENFELNTDFDISGKLESTSMTLAQIMKVMKDDSIGKSTIQAMGDKILLSRFLDNLKVPQMPLLFNTRCKADLPKVQEFVDSLVKAEQSGEVDAFDVVVKPTHLSNGTGAMVLNKETWVEKGLSAKMIQAHMEKYLAEKAADSESEALKSLIPGFIAQPRYKSRVEFKAPLEMRIVTLWGKARLGIWWWGRAELEERQFLVRSRSAQRGWCERLMLRGWTAVKAAGRCFMSTRVKTKDLKQLCNFSLKQCQPWQLHLKASHKL